MDDVAYPQHHRSGAHRVRRHPLLVAVLGLAAVAVVSAALLWVLLSLDVLGVGDGVGDDLLRADSPAAGTATESPSVPVPPDASADAGAGAEASPAPGTELSIDRTAPLVVLNATTTSGLATAAAGVLEEAGWSVDEVGNYGGGADSSVVLWPEEDLASADAAEVVAADLGVGDVAPSAEVDVLTVVVGEDFQP